MRPLSAHTLLRAWEIGQQQHPLERALTLLRFAFPEKSVAELTSFSIGRRDAYLLTLRELTFGPKLNGCADCPQCGDRLEFDCNVADIRLINPDEAVAPEYPLAVAGFELTFRLPNSQDLAAIVRLKDLGAANSLLVKRCLLQASRDGVSIPHSELPPAVVAQLAEQIAECDPQAEVLLSLSCPACSHSWQSLFDIVDFFWTELSAQAKRLLREVHVLARFYGWREADILSMSAVRRQLYLELM